MRLYYLSHDDLTDIIKAALFIGSAKRQVALDAEGHTDLAERVLPWFMLNSRSYGKALKQVIPDWATHFARKETDQEIESGIMPAMSLLEKIRNAETVWYRQELILRHADQILAVVEAAEAQEKIMSEEGCTSKWGQSYYIMVRALERLKAVEDEG